MGWQRLDWANTFTFFLLQYGDDTYSGNCEERLVPSLSHPLIRQFPNMELCSMSCASLDGRGVWGRMDTCMCITESLHCSLETVTTLLISYTPIQNIFGVKKLYIKKAAPQNTYVRMGIKIHKRGIRRKKQPAYEGEGPPPCSDVFTAITIHAHQSLLSTLGTKCAWPWCICLTSEHKQGSNINMIIEVQTTKELHFHLLIINLSTLTPTPRFSVSGWRTPVEIGYWK